MYKEQHIAQTTQRENNNVNVKPFILIGKLANDRMLLPQNAGLEKAPELLGIFHLSGQQRGWW